MLPTILRTLTLDHGVKELPHPESFPGDPPSFLARVPHRYHKVDRVAADLTTVADVERAAPTDDLLIGCASAEGGSTAFVRRKG